MDFNFTLPATSISFGKGMRDKLGILASKHGKKALLISGKGSMKRLGFLAEAKASLESVGMEITEFSGVEPNPSVDTCKGGAELGIRMGCDIVVGIGGGSTIDAAKLIAVGIGQKKSSKNELWDFVTGKSPVKRAIPICAIPSTSGTGSHVTWYSVITNPDVQSKSAFSSPQIYPVESIVDIEICSKMPPKVTAETGFDALAHVMEAYVSKRASPISDTLCIRAMELIRDNLVKAYDNGNDLNAREAMALADTLAGIAITSSKTVLVHAVGNKITGLCPDIAHGQVLASLSPAIMRFNALNGDTFIIKKYCEIAKALGKDVSPKVNTKDALKAADAAWELAEKIGLGKRFSELGAKKDCMERIIASSPSTIDSNWNLNPAETSRDDVLKMYLDSF